MIRVSGIREGRFVTVQIHHNDAVARLAKEGMAGKPLNHAGLKGAQWCLQAFQINLATATGGNHQLMMGMLVQTGLLGQGTQVSMQHGRYGCFFASVEAGGRGVNMRLGGWLSLDRVGKRWFQVV